MGWADGRLAWGCCRPSQAFTTLSSSSASLSSSSALLSSSSESLLSSSVRSLKVCVSCSQHHEHHPHQNFSSCLVVAPGSLTLFLPHCNVHSKCALTHTLHYCKTHTLTPLYDWRLLLRLFLLRPGQGNVPGNDLTHAFTQTEANFERVLRVGVGQVRTWSSQSQSHLSQQLFAISLTCATKLLREVLHSHWRSPPLLPLPTLQKSFSAVHSVQLNRAAHLDQLGCNSDTMRAARYEDLSNPRLATFDFANLLLCKKGAFK